MDSVWEICPKCYGSGYLNCMTIKMERIECYVCNGGKIINKLTGHPRNKTKFSLNETIIR